MSVDACPLVTIDILAYNRREPLRATLRTLFERLDYPADRLEVIVVDNASTDGTAEMVRAEFPRVRVIENAENVGARGVNQGLQAGSGDWFLVLDDDCFVEGDALRHALARAGEEDADLVTFLVLSASREEATSFSRWSTPGLLSFWGCSWLLSRRAVERLGGYDPYFFMWGNEVEMTMRLLDAGFRHLYLPEVRAIHDKPLGEWTLTGHRRNLRHWAYGAAKLLAPRDAAGALGNLLLRVLLESVQRPAILGLAGEVLAGARDGLRNRQPVRPEVSRLYRRHFLEFVSPLRWARGPVARLRTRGVPGAAEADLQRRRDAFYGRRGALYPTTSASLRL